MFSSTADPFLRFPSSPYTTSSRTGLGTWLTSEVSSRGDSSHLVSGELDTTWYRKDGWVSSTGRIHLLSFVVWYSFWVPVLVFCGTTVVRTTIINPVFRSVKSFTWIWRLSVFGVRQKVTNPTKNCISRTVFTFEPFSFHLGFFSYWGFSGLSLYHETEIGGGNWFSHTNRVRSSRKKKKFINDIN